MPRASSVPSDSKGTRFLVYPQPKRLRGFDRPEVIHLRAAPGSIQAGPQDHLAYVVDAVDKVAYAELKGQRGGKPPYTGPRYPPAEPSASNHFDHLRAGTRAFRSATAFATVRLVLEIWEGYFGRQLRWYFRRMHPRLEIIPLLDADNAYSGPGYLELGGASRSSPYCENFDVVAHEVGHLIVRGVIGNPAPNRKTLAFRGHDEAAADLVAIVASLSFESVLDHLLEHTRGNLFSSNEISRLGELGKTTQIRKAFNYLKMSTVKRDRDPDPAVYKYRLSRPFTGGAFDVLVEIYEQGLVDRKAIPSELADRSYMVRGREREAVQKEFARHFGSKRKRFKDALVQARDYFGRLLARTWDKTSLRSLSYPRVAANMIAADVELSGGRYGDVIRECFEWREILPPSR
jgi:hypothetical protein